MEIKSEIAGQLWKCVAREGDTLEADAPIVILESMKMEIPIVAPFACTLEALLVKETDMISEGQVIARIKRQEK